MEQTNDDLDVFGQFITSELRQLTNVVIRKTAKSEKMQVLCKYQAQDIDLQTQSIQSGYVLIKR